MATVDCKLFTYSRRAGGPMVAEHSMVAANTPGFPCGAWPHEFYVQGQRRRVLYRLDRPRDVRDAGGEDLVARVYVPVEDRRVLPEVHLLND